MCTMMANKSISGLDNSQLVQHNKQICVSTQQGAVHSVEEFACKSCKPGTTILCPAFEEGHCDSLSSDIRNK